MDQLILGPLYGPIDVFENATGPDRLRSPKIARLPRVFRRPVLLRRKVLIFASKRRLNVG